MFESFMIEPNLLLKKPWERKCNLIDDVIQMLQSVKVPKKNSVGDAIGCFLRLGEMKHVDIWIHYEPI